MSLRRRVVIGSLAVALVLLAADVALAVTFRGFLLGQLDEQLTQSVGPLLRAAEGSDRLAPPAERPGAPGGPLSEFYLAVAEADGEVMGRVATPLRQDRADPELSAQQVREHATGPGEPLQPFTAGSLDEDGWRLVALQPQGAGGEIVLIGASLQGAAATYQQMLWVLVIGTATVYATLGVVAWWVLRQGVRPLAAMTATAEAIADGELDARVADTDERTEAGRLGAALNTMLARIETAFAERAASEARLRQFVADASHELRTPLTSIRGYTELYRTGALATREQLDEAMHRVEHEAARMGTLVDDLLLLAKLDQGRPLERQPVDLVQLAQDAVADFRAVDPDRTVELDVAPVTVRAEEARLHQAVANLLANVRAHTPPGTPVTVTVGADAGEAILEVADQGPGMPPDVADRVFERFYRGDASRARPGGERAPGSPGHGSGLGLAIVAGVAEAHDGHVSVATAEGQGTRFRLVLPLEPQPAEPAS